MSLPPIVAKITADTKGLTSGLQDAEKRMGMFAKAGAAALAGVVVGMVALTKASLANIDVLAKQARSLGLTTAAFQKMSLVANEAGVESGKLSSMLGLMQRNIEELRAGTAKQVEAFDALGLSMAELQGLNPDEQFARIAEKLDGITDPAQKTALAMEVFGRSGRDAINMLSGYSDAVANAEAFQRRFGIALTDTQSNSVERANDAVGRLGMVFEGLGNQLAVFVAPALEAAANGFISLAGAIFGAREASLEILNYVDAMEQFGDTSRIAAMIGSWQQLTEVMRQEGAIDQLEKLSAAYDALYETVNRATSGMVADIYELSQVSPALAAGLQNLSDRAEELSLKLRDAINAGDLEAAAQFRAELEEVVEQMGLAAEGAGRLSGVDMSGAVAWANSLAVAFGIVADAAYDAAAAAASIPGADYGAMGDDERGSQREQLRSGGEFRRNSAIANRGRAGAGGGGGGGGGIADQLAQRLETLMEGLQTEAEAVAEWYAEQQMTLEEALAAKMLTEAEYMEARERLEKEHQDRLGGIRSMANQSNLQMVLGAGQEILGAIGQTNKKALKVAKVFGAAEALISTYQGAAAALKGPFPGNLAAAAAVIAKGIGFVNAIKSVNEGGGGAASGGGGGAGAGAAQQNLQTMNFSIVNDSFGIGENIIRQIVTQINTAGRNGALIRANVVT